MSKAVTTKSQKQEYRVLKIFVKVEKICVQHCNENMEDDNDIDMNESSSTSSSSTIANNNNQTATTAAVGTNESITPNTNKVLMDASYVMRYLSSHLGLLPECPKHWVRFSEYFQLLESFAEIGHLRKINYPDLMYPF